MTAPQQPNPPLLSDLVEDRLSRRYFLQRATVAGAAVAAASCARPEQEEVSSNGVAERPTMNSNSRADTALDIRHTQSSHTPAIAAGTDVAFHRWDPVLPPVAAERTTRLHWRAQEVPIRINAGSVVAGWTFEGDIPGPTVHVRQGDTVEFTLTNEGAMPHSMDFHAAQIDPRVAFRSVAQGESVSFTFTPRHAGAFMYHCGTAPVLMHIATGMYGAIIVDPPEPLPEAKEFVLVQSEYYVSPGDDGISVFDYAKMLSTFPDFVVFNGRPDQYIQEPIRVSVGDRVRFYVVSAGPTHQCNFHVVGEQFDTVYLGAPPQSAISGVQTFAVPPGGGMIFEFVADVPGEFPFVNHGFGHGQKGAIGFLLVEE